jgi:hypothetical protein
MLEKISRDVASWCWPCLVAKPSHMGVDVDGVACPLYYPMACSRQTRGQGFLPGAVLSRRATVDNGALLGHASQPDLDVCGGADRLGTYVIEFYIERVAFTRICAP